MSPYPEIVELEGELTEVGLFADQSGYGIVVSTDDGSIKVNGMDEIDVGRLASGVFGRVRITIEPIDSEEMPDENAC